MQMVILDRDGVINEDSDAFIKSPQEWIPIPGSLEAIAKLHRADYRVVIATNQSGLARGLLDFDMLMRIHDKMLHQIADAGGVIEAIFFCPHGPTERCKCRKPAPGMFTEIATRFKINLTGVPAIGDSLRDIEAAQAVRARPILVKTGKGQRTVAREENLPGVEVYEDLAMAVDVLLREQKLN